MNFKLLKNEDRSRIFDDILKMLNYKFSEYPKRVIQESIQKLPRLIKSITISETGTIWILKVLLFTPDSHLI
jgi:hypothetical protein